MISRDPEVKQQIDSIFRQNATLETVKENLSAVIESAKKSRDAHKGGWLSTAYNLCFHFRKNSQEYEWLSKYTKALKAALQQAPEPTEDGGLQLQGDEQIVKTIQEAVREAILDLHEDAVTDGMEQSYRPWKKAVCQYADSALSQTLLATRGPAGVGRAVNYFGALYRGAKTHAEKAHYASRAYEESRLTYLPVLYDALTAFQKASEVSALAPDKKEAYLAKVDLCLDEIVRHCVNGGTDLHIVKDKLGGRIYPKVVAALQQKCTDQANKLIDLAIKMNVATDKAQVLASALCEKLEVEDVDEPDARQQAQRQEDIIKLKLTVILAMNAQRQAQWAISRASEVLPHAKQAAKDLPVGWFNKKQADDKKIQVRTVSDATDQDSCQNKRFESIGDKMKTLMQRFKACMEQEPSASQVEKKVADASIASVDEAELAPAPAPAQEPSLLEEVHRILTPTKGYTIVGERLEHLPKAFEECLVLLQGGNAQPLLAQA